MGKAPKERSKETRDHPYLRGDKFNRTAFNKGARTDYEHASGTTFEGFHSAVVYREPKTTTDPGSRFLTHLATALKAWYRATCKKSEIEVQIALFDGQKYLISSNDDATAEQFYAALVKESAASFFRDVATKATALGKRSEATDAYRIERHGRKLTRELSGTRVGGKPLIDAITGLNPDNSVLEKEGATVAIRIDAYQVTAQEMSDFLTGTDKTIAIVTSGNHSAHAEQKIMLALCKAAVADAALRPKTAVFAGTFRPCRGCYESLSVVQRFVFPNLQFGVRPGHYWQSTASAHNDILEVCRPLIKATPNGDFDGNGMMRNLEKKTYRPELLKQKGSRRTVRERNYDTDSDSDTD